MAPLPIYGIELLMLYFKVTNELKFKMTKMI